VHGAACCDGKTGLRTQDSGLRRVVTSDWWLNGSEGVKGEWVKGES
jgi:hypothetical protein